MLPIGKKEELKYIEWYAKYKHKLTSNATAAKLFIPAHITLMVWYEMWQFNSDFTDYQHMWDKGEKCFHIPTGIVRYDEIQSNKDVEVEMALMSKRNEGEIPDSRIVTELNGGSWPVNISQGQPSYEPDSYGIWVKMYDRPVYIPELGTSIVAYGVMEEHLPLVKDCFKHGHQHRRIGGNAIGIQPRTISWICNFCGGDTSQVEYDYLGSDTNHLECELKSTTKNIFQLKS